jgi:hypothetical protein
VPAEAPAAPNGTTQAEPAAAEVSAPAAQAPALAKTTNSGGLARGGLYPYAQVRARQSEVAAQRKARAEQAAQARAAAEAMKPAADTSAADGEDYAIPAATAFMMQGEPEAATAAMPAVGLEAGAEAPATPRGPVMGLATAVAGVGRRLMAAIGFQQ